METMLNFAGLVIFTLAAGALAVFMDWLLLRAAFRAMRPLKSVAAARHRRVEGFGR
jgi:hypothetical protein